MKKYFIILSQCVLAIITALTYPLMIYFIIFLILKELCMFAINIYLKKKNATTLNVEKQNITCTVITYICLLALLTLNPEYSISVFLLITILITQTYSLIQNIYFHIALLNEKKDKKNHGRFSIKMIIILFLAYLIIGAIIPYIKQPEVSKKYKDSFSIENYYSDSRSCDRAAIVEDNGEALNERIQLIESAQKSIILSTFDFRSDTAGKQVAACLKAAADRGVSIKILVDGFNFWTQTEGNPYFIALSDEENIEIKVYNKVNPLLPFKAMSRMHDKYIIADESLYLLGGRNTFDYFLGSQDGYKNYDREVLVYNTGGKNSSIYTLTDYFNQVWNLDYCKTWTHSNLISKSPAVKKASNELHVLYETMKVENPEQFSSCDYREKTVPTNKISLLSNPTGLYSKEPWVFYGLCQLMLNAKESALIHTPYVVANDMMYDSLSEITQSGVPVTIMTNSSSNNGNVFGAVDYVLNKDKILDTGVSVLEYNGGISYHGKSLIIDDNISIVGSFNMDMKSLYQDTELMLVIDSEELNSQFREILETYHEDSVTAKSDENEMNRLLSKEVPLGKRILRRVVKFADPVVRFLF